MKTYVLKMHDKASGRKSSVDTTLRPQSAKKAQLLNTIKPQAPDDAREAPRFSGRSAPATTPPKCVVCLGLDLHEKQITAVRQIDGLLPQPAQRFSREELLIWAGGFIAKGWEVHSCYEAGCFGYTLHRELLALGVHNLVVAPQNWCGAAKTDKRDAREMCLRLERYVRGNTRSLSVVRVPSVEQERLREEGRHRQRLLQERKRAELRGSSLMRLAGQAAPSKWWQLKNWVQLRRQLEPKLAAQLEVWQQKALEYEKLLRAASRELIRQGKELQAGLPAGFGALSWRMLQGEIIDWKRFSSRRKVSSYSGLCPGEQSSGESQRQGSINRHGNGRIRTLLIEAVWRLTRHEPQWRGFKKFPELLDPKAGKRGRKRAVVGAARVLIIDLWRLACGHTTAKALGFQHDFVTGTTPSVVPAQ